MDIDTQHNNLIKPLTNKLVNEIKEKHLVSLIAEYEPSTFRTQYHVNVVVGDIPCGALALLNKKNYTCIYYDDTTHASEYKRLSDIGYSLQRAGYRTQFVGHVYGFRHINCPDLINEYNEIIMKLFITPQVKFFNEMFHTKHFILVTLIKLQSLDILSKLISMEEQSIIKYFTENTEYEYTYESPLYDLAINKHINIIEQIIALEDGDISYYFKDLLCELDDELCVKILTNHIPHTP